MAEMPKGFLQEFSECFADLELDLNKTITEIDQQVGLRIKAFIVEMFRLADGKPEPTVQNLMSGMLWMFMAGREHALRGFDAPVPKHDSGNDGWVPNTIAGLLRDDL